MKPKQIQLTTRPCRVLLISVGIGLSTACGCVQAASERILQLEEVLVTAQKREESLQETPISITAFSPQMLEQLGINAPHEVADFTPNLIADVKPATSIQATYAIRGFGQGESFAEPRVAVYLDGIYTAAGPAFDLVDLERMEVLRGPQGTLFGRNTVGGAINVITARPAEEFGFKQQLSFGNRGYWRSVTSVDVPLADALQTKWTFLKTETDGWANNNFVGAGVEKDLGGDDTEAYRVAARWQVTEAITLDYSYDHTDVDFVPLPGQLSYIDPSLPGNFDGSYEQAAANVDDQRRGEFDLDNAVTDTSKNRGHNLVISWELDSVTLKWLSGFRDSQSTFPNDLDGGAYLTTLSHSEPPSLSDSDSESHELQAVGSWGGRFDYAVGLYYWESEGDSENRQVGGFPAFPPFIFSFFTDALNTFENDSTAVYGQFTYTPDILEDRLRLTLGGRYTEDTRAASIPNLDAAGKSDFDNFSPSGSADMQWTPQLSSYFKISQGYTAGGWNNRAFNAESFAVPVDEENVTSYEVGIKSQWLDQRIRLNAAVFYNDFTDQQISQFLAGADGFTSITVNAAESTMQGFELEILAVPSEGLTLNLGWGYLDAEFEKYEAVGPETEELVDVSDTTVAPYAPEHTVNAGLQYQFPAFGFGRLTARLDGSYRSKSFSNIFKDRNEFTTLDNRYLLNARIGLHALPWVSQGDLRIAIWGKNLTNEKYRQSSIHFGPLGFATVTYGKLRSTGVDIIYEY